MPTWLYVAINIVWWFFFIFEVLCGLVAYQAKETYTNGGARFTIAFTIFTVFWLCYVFIGR